MRAILLCPGPSLTRFSRQPDGALVVAVNRAALAHPCQVWSVGDTLTIRRYGPRLPNRPTVWTHPDTARELAGWDVMQYARLESLGWPCFSATAGLWLCGALGAERVDVYGADMAGEKNWDGTDEPTANRTEQRWVRERRAWDELVTAMQAKGCEVIRHGLDG